MQYPPSLGGQVMHTWQLYPVQPVLLLSLLVQMQWRQNHLWQEIITCQLYQQQASFTTLTIVVNAEATEIFVTGKNYLTALSATASFTYLIVIVANNVLATQSWVTGNGYLTALLTTANFTTLTLANNAVATQPGWWKWISDSCT